LKKLYFMARLGQSIELAGILHRFSSEVVNTDIFNHLASNGLLATDPRLFSLLKENKKQIPTPYAVSCYRAQQMSTTSRLFVSYDDLSWDIA